MLESNDCIFSFIFILWDYIFSLRKSVFIGNNFGLVEALPIILLVSV